MTEIAARVGFMTVAELEARRRTGAPPLVLDVRNRAAWVTRPERIPGALWVPLEEVPARVRDLPTDRPIVVYCS
jgi:rhodanese-related sulfurtransferase